MKNILLLLTVLLTVLYPLTSAPMKKGALHYEAIEYKVGQTIFKCHLYYQNNISSKRPGILVLPEWWGCNEYTKRRATMLAELGYVAMAVDMYGEGKLADNPTDASALASPFFENVEKGIPRMEAAIEKLKTISMVDTTRMAAIGYCFGGGQVLNAARKGVNLKAVVCFHGSLKGIKATKNSTRAKILVCHGTKDEFVSEEDVKAFKQNLDTLQVTYQFKTYNGTHAFSNPEATATGKKFNLPIAYSAEADRASWSDMKDFLKECLK